jgi:hypothetical protein
MSNFKLSLNTKISDKKDIIANLFIENISDRNCFVSKDSIMLDGFKNNKFSIVNEKGEEAVYQGRLVKYYPELILIKPNEIMSSELNLSSIYKLQKASELAVTYKTHINCCEDKEGQSCDALEFFEVQDFIGLINSESGE